MIELVHSGLPIFLNDDGSLIFKSPLEEKRPSFRRLEDMREYLADPEASFDRDSIYEMYRQIFLPADAEKFKKANLRFDLTVFHPGKLGCEFSKTIGHFHPKNQAGLNYPEIYEVLSGTAYFLIQKMDDSFEKILEAYLIKVNEGQHAVFPAGFGHVTINATDKELVTANFVADVEGIYQPYKTRRGAAYYLLQNKEGNLEIQPNKNYKNLPALKNLKPKETPEFSAMDGQPMYISGQSNINMLEYLNKPELYSDKLSIQNCFTLLKL
ncbi:MAG: glucose-6-phosphate isomerase family protein [Candidatus Portnoybacteria bacterium]|nr:glucose-6-phosphate isomerase family protein [Candidatus Portnoybacteria bacterium]